MAKKDKPRPKVQHLGSPRDQPIEDINLPREGVDYGPPVDELEEPVSMPGTPSTMSLTGATTGRSIPRGPDDATNPLHEFHDARFGDGAGFDPSIGAQENQAAYNTLEQFAIDIGIVDEPSALGDISVARVVDLARMQDPSQFPGVREAADIMARDYGIQEPGARFKPGNRMQLLRFDENMNPNADYQTTSPGSKAATQYSNIQADPSAHVRLGNRLTAGTPETIGADQRLTLRAMQDPALLQDMMGRSDMSEVEFLQRVGRGRPETYADVGLVARDAGVDVTQKPYEVGPAARRPPPKGSEMRIVPQRENTKSKKDKR